MAFFPVPQTPNDIIDSALRAAGILGVGQDASDEDLKDGFQHLNMMLAEWNTKRAHVYSMSMHQIQCTGGQTYSVGPGGDFSIPRPDHVEAAFITQNYQGDNPIDFPLTLLNSMEDYARIGLKKLSSFPSLAYYDQAFPVGNLYIWPVAQPQYHLTIVTRDMLQGFSTPADDIILPPQYHSAILWNLAVRLCVLYRVDPGSAAAQARATLNAITNVNAQVPTLSMPGAVRGSAGAFNIYGDSYATKG